MLKIVAVILAPALFWLLYHRWKDRHRPEPGATCYSATVAACSTGRAKNPACKKIAAALGVEATAGLPLKN